VKISAFTEADKSDFNILPFKTELNSHTTCKGLYFYYMRSLFSESVSLEAKSKTATRAFLLRYLDENLIPPPTTQLDFHFGIGCFWFGTDWL